MPAADSKDIVAISLGGSILAPDTIDPAFVRSVGELLVKLSAEFKLVVVTGGGRTARRYITAGRELGASEFFLDEMGIRASRLNARLLQCVLGNRCPSEIPEELSQAMELANTHPIVLMGGTHPGHTTDAVAALLAEGLGAARFVNATSVDGVYDKDPNKFTDAKHIPKLTADELLAICIQGSTGAGPNVVLDPLAARVVARSGVPGAIVDGRDLAALEAAIKGEPFKGTIVTPSRGGA